jgi:hypothetical protein
MRGYPGAGPAPCGLGARRRGRGGEALRVRVPRPLRSLQERCVGLLDPWGQAAQPGDSPRQLGSHIVPVSPFCSRSEPFVALQSQKLDDPAVGLFERRSSPGMGTVALAVRKSESG